LTGAFVDAEASEAQTSSLSLRAKTRWPEKAGRSPGAFFAAIVGDGIEQVKAAHIAAIDWKLDERANEIVAELCTYHCGVTVSNV
jgi:hypothetical protein